MLLFTKALNKIYAIDYFLPISVSELLLYPFYNFLFVDITLKFLDSVENLEIFLKGFEMDSIRVFFNGKKGAVCENDFIDKIENNTK